MMRSGLTMLGAALLLAAGGCYTPRALPGPQVGARIPAWARPEVAVHVTEPADDPAELCPADARLYLRVDGMGFGGEPSGDPLAEHVRSVVRSFGLHLGGPSGLGPLFGRTVAVVEQHVEGRRAAVVIARADGADSHRLLGSLGLEPWGWPGSRVGPFRTYRSDGGKGPVVVAIGERWVVLAEARDAAHLRRLIAGVGQYRAGFVAESRAAGVWNAAGVEPLADAPVFGQLVEKLPTEHASLMYTRDARRSDHHALAVSGGAGEPITIRYAARAASLGRLGEPLSSAAEVEFGPLPDSTITAASLHEIFAPSVLDRLSRSRSVLGMLNLTLFPHKFEEKVEPNLEAPLVGFLGESAADRSGSDPASEAPVFGVAVRLSDPAAADYLDRVVRGVHRLVHLGELNLLRGLIGGGVRTAAAGGVRYQVADFGDAIERRIRGRYVVRQSGWPAEVRHLAFGRIGDWYVICSQEAFFRRCIEAHEDADLRLESVAGFERFDFERRPGLVLSALTHAPRLRSASASGDRMDQDASESAAPDPRDQVWFDAEDRIAHPLRWAAEAVQRRRALYVQVWRDPDEPRGLLGELRALDRE